MSPQKARSGGPPATGEAPSAGVINVLKPPGMTSHDVVAWVRRRLGVKAGHGGTLDPGAAGVLVVGVGRATRLLGFLLEGTKDYRVEVVLGARTPTGDASSPEEPGGDASPLDRQRVERAMAALTGEITQVPPMTSAIKRGGQPLYALARRGKEVPRPPRRVTVFRAQLLEFMPGPRAHLLVDLTCSHGTYVRTWCQDLGELLGVGGYMRFLVRTRVAGFRLEESALLEEIRDHPGRAVAPAVRMVEHLPALLARGGREKVACGRIPRHLLEVPASLSPGQRARVMGPEGDLWAIARWTGEGDPIPETVLVGVD